MTENRVFDWRPKPDPRNLDYRFRALATGPSAACTSLRAYRSVRHRRVIFLDQGSEGACTGYGEEHVRALSPRQRIVTNESAKSIYYEARKQDEWAGEDYEGSSVNGAMKAARLQGKIRAWYWCMDLAEIRHALSYHGGVEAGTNWYSGMWNTDSDGLVHVTGEVVGGHAWALAGYRQVNGTRQYRIENSWGQSWGDGGGAWIWESDLSELLANQGEFACPKKV